MKRAMKLQVSAICVLLAMLSVECSKNDVTSLPPDVESPSYVIDLEVTYTTIVSATLTWTATGDDGDRGTASRYDVRYAIEPITEDNWESVSQVDGEPLPKAAGETEVFIVRGLDPDSDYHFAIKAADEELNWSGISNTDSARTELYREGQGTWWVPDDAGTIQEAIDAANPGDTVLVKSGTYCERNIFMKSDITLLGETGEADGVIIDAGGEGRVMYCEDLSTGTTIKGFTFTNGAIDLMMNGAGMYLANSSPSIVNCDFISNMAQGHGGGIQCMFYSAPHIENCSFTGNDVMGHGAGIACMYDSNPIIEDCVFEENETRCHGGAISCVSGSAPTITDCLFSGNSAMGEGGAISVVSGSSPTITGCRFDGNSTMGMGGALGISSASTPNLSYCVFTHNVSRHGAAMSFSSSTPVVTNCTFAFNEASLGSVLLSDVSITEIRNSIIAHNSGSTVVCQDGDAPVFTCSDLFGNSGGDWVGCIESQLGQDGNISLDPLFCGDANPAEPCGLTEGSPCAAIYNPSCGLIGALQVLCAGSL
jgi:predicted outer membrane repeat protein